MRRLACITLGALSLCIGCSTTALRLPVRPEPATVRNSTACNELGPPDLADSPKSSTAKHGWALIRFDVEQGDVVNLQITDSSPEKTFDADTMAFFEKMRFPSRGTAHGCVWSHKWG
ncbi:energy transducer TonB [Roseateles chitinivorans]|uniref:energy transducer TonB n=1 Tax=Roseateles chitinivorans TaxID=2917965 RepID=UPI003D671B4A